MDPIIIEKDIPMPTKNSRRGQSTHKYDFLHKMNVSDSVELKVLKAPYTPGEGTRKEILTYFGLMNAIHRVQKDTKILPVRTATTNNFNINPTPTALNKKFATRTIRLEDAPKGMIRVMRIWRIQ